MLIGTPSILPIIQGGEIIKLIKISDDEYNIKLDCADKTHLEDGDEVYDFIDKFKIGIKQFME